jgi:hypothetical protein
MRLTLLVALLAMPLQAHRLDEYLQATTISLERNRVQLHLRLTPGVSIAPIILALIDEDANGVLSSDEQKAYAQQVAKDLRLTIDGQRTALRLLSQTFPSVAEIEDGQGEIQLELEADLPSNVTKLTLENHHRKSISAFLVNCLSNPKVAAQRRNQDQSFYELTLG